VNLSGIDSAILLKKKEVLNGLRNIRDGKRFNIRGYMMHRREVLYRPILIVALMAITSMLVIFFAVFSTASDDMNKGAEKMILEGGNRGKVPFAHRDHQEKAGDCNICHSIFPKQPGSIQNLINKGELKKKKVMKKLCIKCHKTERMAGNPYGPTTCSKCHIR